MKEKKIIKCEFCGESLEKRFAKKDPVLRDQWCCENCWCELKWGIPH
jgi:hypothetical protein